MSRSAVVRLVVDIWATPAKQRKEPRRRSMSPGRRRRRKRRRAAARGRRVRRPARGSLEIPPTGRLLRRKPQHAPRHAVSCRYPLLSLDYQHGAQATSFELVGAMLAAVQASLSFSAPGSGLPSRVAAPATRAADPSMCGILATVNSKLSPEALRLQTLTLQRLIRHRGPDGSGINLIENADGTCSAIAHERLAIVDPLAGNQPLYSKVSAEQLSPYPCTQAHTPDLKRQSNRRRSREAQPQQAPPASAAPASSPVPSRALLVEHSFASRAAAGLEQQQTPRPADLQTRRLAQSSSRPLPAPGPYTLTWRRAQACACARALSLRLAPCQDRKLSLAINGEIYNHKELRAEINDESKFRTNSDCEPVVHLYEQAPICLVRLRVRGQGFFRLRAGGTPLRAGTRTFKSLPLTRTSQATPNPHLPSYP